VAPPKQDSADLSVGVKGRWIPVASLFGVIVLIFNAGAAWHTQKSHEERLGKVEKLEAKVAEMGGDIKVLLERTKKP
jgi:hypothetical protein